MEKTALKFVWHYIKIFKWFFISMILCLVIGQTSRQVATYFLSRLFAAISTYASAPQSWRFILFCVFMFFALQFFGSLIINSHFLLVSRVVPKLRTLVIKDTFDYVNSHSMAFFDEEMAGNISNKVQQLQNGVCDLVVNSLDASWSYFYVLIGLIVLGSVSIWLTPVFVLWAVLVICLGFCLGRKLSTWSKITSDEQSHANGMIVDSLANYREIKSFSNFKYERLNLLKALRMLRKAETKEQFGQGMVIIIQHSTVIVSTALFMLYSVWLFAKEYLSAADFIFVNTLFTTMGGIIFNITWNYNGLLRILGRMSSALNTIAIDPEVTDYLKAKKLKVKKASIVFNDVEFAYKGCPRIFKGLNVEIKAGEKIGLVGASGAGKSTFIKLLSRYFDVTSGSILINGTDIRNITQDSLRQNIATIPQDVCLFNRSLYDNILYGRTSATMQEVLSAAKKASADEFIRHFPNGYDTKVGDRGVILSGGERQRIAIARAVLKNAPILVFDEATSALDSENEKHIQDSLAKLMKGKTVIAVAHRLSTLREMDRILVFDKGKIIEEGSHDELLQRGKKYAKLFKMQSDGFVK